MTIRRVLIYVGVAALISGCHLLRANCHAPQEYQQARQLAPLKVPAGLDSPDVANALIIPSAGLVPPSPGANDACLDEPPRFEHAPVNKAAGGERGVEAQGRFDRWQPLRYACGPL